MHTGLKLPIFNKATNISAQQGLHQANDFDTLTGIQKKIMILYPIGMCKCPHWSWAGYQFRGVLLTVSKLLIFHHIVALQESIRLCASALYYWFYYFNLTYRFTVCFILQCVFD